MGLRWKALWRNLTRRERAARDLVDEIEGAFDSTVDDLVAAGHSPDEARRLAVLRFGRPEQVVAAVRDVKAGAFVETIYQDVRFGLRQIRRAPLFALFVAASLALAIGATGATFSLFDALVLRTLPVPEPERLVVASFGLNGRYNYSLPFPQFQQIHDRTTTLSSVFAFYPCGRLTVATGSRSEIAEGIYVTGDYYRGLQLTPALGRLLGPEDDRTSAPVAVLSYAYWQRLGRPAAIVGTVARLNTIPFTIVGVEPDGFVGTEVGRPYDISLPMRASERLSDGPALWDQAFATWIYVMGRLRPGVTVAEAEAESRALFGAASEQGARDESERRLARGAVLRLEPAATGNFSDLRSAYGRWVTLLLAVLASVLLLASLNVATLLLSRADARRREIATRLALGAGRARIVRQLLTESLVLAVVAGACGLALATWGSRMLLALAMPSASQPLLDLGVDWRLVAFTAALSILACLLFGLVPALRGTAVRGDLATRGAVAAPRRGLIDGTLIVAQVTISLVLLVGAGLFLRTLDELWSRDVGYDRSAVFMFSVDARLAGKRGSDVPDTYRRVLDELGRLPAVRQATASAVRPVSDDAYFVSSVGQIGDRLLSDDNRVRVAFNTVAPGYFATLQMPLLAGRDFDARDTTGSPPVVIISERMARHFSGQPVGQRIGNGTATREVIGVVADVAYARIQDEPREVLYFPLLQQEARGFGYAPTFELRYDGLVADVRRQAEQAVARVDPALQPFAITTLESQTARSLTRERLLALLTTVVGTMALLLSCIGLFGIVSDRVTLRMPELGIRLALGARPISLQWLVVRQALITVALGVIVGLGVAALLAKAVRAQLFAVEPTDPLASAGSTALLVLVAAVASAIPARRAGRVDPLVALRRE